MCICCNLLAIVSGGSHWPPRIASERFERECNTVRADRLWVQQSSHQPLCVVPVATVDQAPQCGPSPGEGTWGHCKGVEELHWQGKRRYCTFVAHIVHDSLYECVLCMIKGSTVYVVSLYWHDAADKHTSLKKCSCFYRIRSNAAKTKYQLVCSDVTPGFRPVVSSCQNTLCHEVFSRLSTYFKREHC